MAAISDLLSGLPTRSDVARLGTVATGADLEALGLRLVGALSAPPAQAEGVAQQVAREAAQAVEDQVADLLEEVKVGQQRMQLLVLAVGVAFLVFAALISVLALL